MNEFALVRNWGQALPLACNFKIYTYIQTVNQIGAERRLVYVHYHIVCIHNLSYKGQEARSDPIDIFH